MMAVNTFQAYLNIEQSILRYATMATQLDASSMTPLPALVALRTTEPTYGMLTDWRGPTPASKAFLFSSVFRYALLLSEGPVDGDRRRHSQRGKITISLHRAPSLIMESVRSVGYATRPSVSIFGASGRCGSKVSSSMFPRLSRYSYAFFAVSHRTLESAN